MVLQMNLDSLHTQFVDAMGSIVKSLSFPHLEMHILSHEGTFQECIKEIEPLPKELAEGLAAKDPRAYSPDQLDALHKIGQNLREAVIRQLKVRGNTHWNKAATLTGNAASRELHAAEDIWAKPFMSSSLDGIAGLCNMAHSALKKNRCVCVSTSIVQTEANIDFSTPQLHQCLHDGKHCC